MTDEIHLKKLLRNCQIRNKQLASIIRFRKACQPVLIDNMGDYVLRVKKLEESMKSLVMLFIRDVVSQDKRIKELEGEILFYKENAKRSK